MARIVQTRDPELSLFQSAIDEIAIHSKAGGGAQSVGDAISNTDRPGVEDPMVREAAFLIPDVALMRMSSQSVLPTGPAPTGAVTEGVGEVVKYCASLAFNLAKAKFTGNTAVAEQCQADLTAKTGTCDARYAEAAEITLKYFNAMHGTIPYVDWKDQSDFVIDGTANILPTNAKIAVIGDWGTGQDQALAVLTRLAEKAPDVVIHLGDVYYAGTDNEQQFYFFDNWCKILGLTTDANRQVTSTHPATFSIPGNHDMYTGGAPYYKMIKQLGQQASFFCLRNKDWQFIGLDTGYHDHGLGDPSTHLPDRQSDWLADKVNNSNNRKTVLLSHHQLFSNRELFTSGARGEAPAPVNPLLLKDVEPILKNINLWLWGHEHAFTAYADDRVKGRCMGHGAYPVGIPELGTPGNAIKVDPAIALQQHGNKFWDNGYVIIELNGPSATVTYYAVDENGDERDSPSTETI